MSKTNYEKEGLSSNNNSTSLNSLSFKLFDQTEGSGIRKILAPQTPGGQATSEQYGLAANAIIDYIEHRTDMGLPKEDIPSALFSLNFHAFQSYIQSNENEKMEKMRGCVLRAREQIENMNPSELESLRRLMGPTILPYLEATMLFVDDKIDIVNKQQQLNTKLEEILQVPINQYPISNVVYFAGRVSDMANNPGMAYSSLFALQTKLPPLPGETEWVKASSYEQHMAYLENLQSNEAHRATPIGGTQAYIEKPLLDKKIETLHDIIITPSNDAVINAQEYKAVIDSLATLTFSEQERARVVIASLLVAKKISSSLYTALEKDISSLIKNEPQTGYALERAKLKQDDEQNKNQPSQPIKLSPLQMQPNGPVDKSNKDSEEKEKEEQLMDMAVCCVCGQQHSGPCQPR